MYVSRGGVLVRRPAARGAASCRRKEKEIERERERDLAGTHWSHQVKLLARSSNASVQLRGSGGVRETERRDQRVERPAEVTSLVQSSPRRTAIRGSW